MVSHSYRSQSGARVPNPNNSRQGNSRQGKGTPRKRDETPAPRGGGGVLAVQTKTFYLCPKWHEWGAGPRRHARPWQIPRFLGWCATFSADDNPLQ